MQFILILLVIAGGMGLSVEAGLLGPLGGKVGDLWATFSIFGVGAAMNSAWKERCVNDEIRLDWYRRHGGSDCP